MGENDIRLRLCEWFKNATPEDRRTVQKLFLTLQMSHLVWKQREFYTGRGCGKLTKEQVKELKHEYARMLTGGKGPGRPKGATTKKGLGQKGDRRKPYVDLWLKGVRKPEYYHQLLAPEMPVDDFKDYFENNLSRTFRRWDRQAAIALDKAKKKRKHPPFSFIRPTRGNPASVSPITVN